MDDLPSDKPVILSKSQSNSAYRFAITTLTMKKLSLLLLFAFASLSLAAQSSYKIKGSGLSSVHRNMEVREVIPLSDGFRVLFTLSFDPRSSMSYAYAVVDVTSQGLDTLLVDESGMSNMTKVFLKDDLLYVFGFTTDSSHPTYPSAGYTQNITTGAKTILTDSLLVTTFSFNDINLANDHSAWNNRAAGLFELNDVVYLPEVGPAQFFSNVFSNEYQAYGYLSTRLIKDYYIIYGPAIKVSTQSSGHLIVLVDITDGDINYFFDSTTLWPDEAYILDITIKGEQFKYLTQNINGVLGLSLKSLDTATGAITISNPPQNGNSIYTGRILQEGKIALISVDQDDNQKYMLSVYNSGFELDTSYLLVDAAEDTFLDTYFTTLFRTSSGVHQNLLTQQGLFILANSDEVYLKLFTEEKFVNIAPPVYSVPNLQLYPNPARYTVTLKGVSPGADVQVYSTAGVAMPVTFNRLTNHLDVQYLSPGTYIVRNGAATARLVVQP